jgi:hypothetical protein
LAGGKDGRMSTWKKLALIAAGYVLSVVGGCAAVAVNEAFMPDDVANGSPGMVAFGDMILLVLVTGFLGLVPTWFLLRLFVQKAPHALLAIVLVIAALGPLSWLMMTALALATPPGGPSRFPDMPEALTVMFGLFIAFIAIPRMVFGPVLMVIEGVTFFLVRTAMARRLMVAAMLMDLVPIGMYALHFARRVRY